MKIHDLSPLFECPSDALSGFGREDILRPHEKKSGYPPYNIDKLAPNLYRLTLAVAGFSENDLSIAVQSHILIISGKMAKESDGIQSLYRGIAGRAFEKHFQLGDFIHIIKASLENGLLMIILERELPEALKPRHIAIETRHGRERLLEQKKNDDT